MSLSASPVAPSPAPDRRRTLLGHLTWEAVLLVLTAIAVVVVLVADNVPISILWSSLATLGLTATGLALSLRTGTPNIMVGSVGLLAGLVYTQLVNGGGSSVVAALVAVAAVTLVGAVVGVVVGVLTAPAWVVTLGAGLLVQAYVLARLDGQTLQLQGQAEADSTFPILWTVVFVVVSVAGGAAWMFADDVRARLSGAREQVGPGRIEPTRVLAAVLGVGGSSALAGIAGVLVVQSTRAVFPGGGDRLALALGAVLLGGVSIYGRRGGLAGTALAVVLLGASNLLLSSHGATFYVTGLVVPALAILLGLVVGRVLEQVSGPDIAPTANRYPLDRPPTQPDPFAPGTPE